MLQRQLFFLFLFISSQVMIAQNCILINAHAHNDYKQKHPLSDALNNKFSSIEVDVFLINNKLIVSHTYPILKKRNTIEKLYLQPLLDSCLKNNGSVYADCSTPLILLVEIKSDANQTYIQLKKIIENYTSILTKYEHGKIIPNAVTIILTGNKPYELLSKEDVRYAFIDQNLLRLEKQNDAIVCMMASTKYSNLIRWNGKGNMPKEEKEKLTTVVQVAHQQGKIVRLWASPENKKVWTELLNCGVDLINTDELEKLNSFLMGIKK